MSAAFPDWVQPDVFVCHKPSRTVFLPAKRGRKLGHLVLLDPAGKDYRVDECNRFSLADVQAEAATLVTEAATLIIVPHPHALIVTDGQRRMRVEMPGEVDEGEAAARSLAAFFNGVYIGEVSDAVGP